ncbi:hypothetical protein PF004_g13572 [Phytophthora fragariae]|uniref:Uncharacterized protein n=2 Tax=Phytophthora fragariae TaxID=53985 RepID=A0A6G0NRR4_9STRA|nr:hypothetical protein PF004_g13572 [Phytophthora fragariae]
MVTKRTHGSGEDASNDGNGKGRDDLPVKARAATPAGDAAPPAGPGRTGKYIVYFGCKTKMNQALKAMFWNEGYLIGNLQVADAILQEALEEGQQLLFSPILSEVYELERNPNRLQASITTFGPAMEKEYHTIRNIVTRSDKE